MGVNEFDAEAPRKGAALLGAVRFLSKWITSRLSVPACCLRRDSAGTHAAISDTFYRDTRDARYLSDA